MGTPRKARDADLNDVEIIFATPVYTTNERRTHALGREQNLEREVRRLKGERRDARQTARRVWLEKGRMVGLVERQLLGNIRNAIRAIRSRQGVPLPRIVRENTEEEDDDEDDDEEDEEGGDNDAPVRIPRTEQELQPIIDREVREILNGVINQAGASAARLRQAWVDDYREALRLQLASEHRYDLAMADLREVRKQLRQQGMAEGATSPPDILPTRPWPAEHVVNLTTDNVQWPENFYWRADKRTFGEWTTANGKVAAYRMFVWMLRDVPANRLQLIVTRSSSAVSTGPACGQLKTGAFVSDRLLPSAATVLECVHAQWSHLAVWTRADDPEHILRLFSRKTPHLGSIYCDRENSRCQPRGREAEKR